MKNLKELTYDYNEFDEVIDSATMEIHHSKHLAAYYSNYNNLINGTKFEDMCVKDVIQNLNEIDESIRVGVRNNGGGMLNHNLYFSQFKKETVLPEGEMKEKIISTFGSVEELIKQINATAMSRFGSGWAWLVLDGQELKVMSTANQDSPLMDGFVPLIGIDVWEHAYYLKYQNRRAEYLENIWKIMDWEKINERFKK